MKDITTTPTADLIAELRELENNAKADPVSLEDVYARREKAKRHSEICHELDRRLDNAGIEYIVGLPVFTKFEDYEIPTPEKDYLPHLESATLAMTLEELRDLLTWIIIKNAP